MFGSRKFYLFIAKGFYHFILFPAPCPLDTFYLKIP